MSKVSEITEPYFSHDIAARSDEKIMKMFYAFRKQVNTIERKELEALAVLGSYGLFWLIVEYMHRNTLYTTDLDVIADEFRVPEKFVKMVLEDFELFKKDKEHYISDRILENLNKMQEKADSKSKAAKTRWALSKLKSIYTEIFGSAPALSNVGIDTYMKYTETIPDFKNKIADILYTLQGLKFENNPKFNPNIDWLLEGNHMTKLINGEYGKLKNWAAEKERRREAKEKSQKQKLNESERIEIETISNRIDAVDLLLKHSIWLDNMNTLKINPDVFPLLKKFEINKQEIEVLKRKELENA